MDSASGSHSGLMSMTGISDAAAFHLTDILGSTFKNTTTGRQAIDTSSSIISLNGGGISLQYILNDVWDCGADPRVSLFPLMKGGPWPVIAVLMTYLLIITHIGPRVMRHRSAFDLRSPILVYNIFMMMINLYFFYSASIYTSFGLQTWGCIPINPLDWDDSRQWKLLMIWFFFISKFIDLFETIFFILRKKETQVSFLHVFHHCIVPIDVWVGFKYSPSESAAFFPLVNSLVHTIMYAYYALSTLGPSVRPFLWWKRYLTQLQIFQLILVAIHCVHLVLIPECNIPKAVFAIYLPQVMFLVYLFISFFVNNYTIMSKGMTKQQPSGSQVDAQKRPESS